MKAAKVKVVFQASSPTRHLIASSSSTSLPIFKISGRIAKEIAKKKKKRGLQGALSETPQLFDASAVDASGCLYAPLSWDYATHRAYRSSLTYPVR